MSYDALRRGRHSIAGSAYHVTIVTLHRKPLFHDFSIARLVISEMRRMDLDGHSETLAWVLMPDHLHWLFGLGKSSTLAGTMHRFKGCSARRINEHRRAQGPVWQRAYHDHAVRAQEDLLQLSRYIVANPLRAGLVDEIGQYPHWGAVWLEA